MATVTATTYSMIDLTCDEPYDVQVVHVETDDACVGCDKPLIGRLAIQILDDFDTTMCLGCFDDSVDSCATRIIATR
jgi:hypothetical protein